MEHAWRIERILSEVIVPAAENPQPDLPSDASSDEAEPDSEDE